MNRTLLFAIAVATTPSSFAAHTKSADVGGWTLPAEYFDVGYRGGEIKPQGGNEVDIDTVGLELSEQLSNHWRVSSTLDYSKYQYPADNGYGINTTLKFDIGIDLIRALGLSGYLSGGLGYFDWETGLQKSVEVTSNEDPSLQDGEVITLLQDIELDGFGAIVGGGVEFSPACFIWLQARYEHAIFDDMETRGWSLSLSVPFASNEDIGYALSFQFADHEREIATGGLDSTFDVSAFGVSLRISF